MKVRRFSVAVGASIVSLVGLHSLIALPVGSSSVTSVECLEDQPCWACASMGNKICGPTVPDYVWEACEGTIPGSDHVCGWVHEVG